ncbi:MAG: hypothetical protein MUC62_03630 [Candidatus Thermoplasmatota archaeon]|nr:hypothetical protein [Candidatus Thermoplasmatota archaeon]
MRSVEEDLDRAANSLLELGVQPFHLIRPVRSFCEPLEIEGDISDRIGSRLSLMRKVGSGNPLFEEEFARALILGGMGDPLSNPAIPGCRVIRDRETLMRMASLARAIRARSYGTGDGNDAFFREDFLFNAFVRSMVKGGMGGPSISESADMMYRPGFQAAPISTNWSYWFDWLYFLMDHPTGEGFHEPPQCMNCGRCLDDLGVQECPGCGEDPWQWWFQWFYARHAPEDMTERSWDMFQLHTYTDGRVFHPRTEGWISSLTHIPVQEEGRFRLDVVSRAVVIAPLLWAPPGGIVDLDIWHSVGFGPYPATSIRHPSYNDANGIPVEFAHRSPFEKLIMRGTLDARSGEHSLDIMEGAIRYDATDPVGPGRSKVTIGSSTIDTGEMRDGKARWNALTPVVEGPGVFIVREEVTYILEDPLASGYRSILPIYTGQPGGWFEPLSYRVVEADR